MDLSVLGREIIDDLNALTPDRGVKFEAELGIQAYGDETLVRILLTNLLQNAWKYTAHNDDAWIELGLVEDEDEGPIYHVRDNGIGFDNANKEIIFQAFERLHTRAEFSGSGLGLATVERIVSRHRGRVWADGVLGAGAVFRFTLGSPGTEPAEGERRRGER
jgi:light-regulated signal transduction histidine kinase (bacteriophytochrome)